MGNKPKNHGRLYASTVIATVLVVEDDPDVRQIVVRTLSDLGCNIIEAKEGKAARRPPQSRPAGVTRRDGQHRATVDAIKGHATSLVGT